MLHIIIYVIGTVQAESSLVHTSTCVASNPSMLYTVLSERYACIHTYIHTYVAHIYKVSYVATRIKISL